MRAWLRWHREEVIVAALFAALVALCGVAAYHAARAKEACEARGDRWVCGPLELSYWYSDGNITYPVYSRDCGCEAAP